MAARKLYAVLYQGVDESQLALREYIKPHPDIIRVSVGADAPAGDISIEDALENENLDIIFIPGGKLPEDTTALSEAVKTLATKTSYLISLDEGTKLLARTGLLDGKIAATTTSAVSDLQGEFPNTRWEDISLYRTGIFWTAAGGSDALKPLGNIFSLGLRGIINYWYPFLPDMPRKRPPPSDSPEDPATTESNKKRPSPAEIIALELSTAPDRSTFFSVAGQFAARLACEGFLDAGNTVLLALLEIFPNSQEDIGIYVTQSFEFLWERAGARPPVPWEQPSDEQLAEWEESMRGNWPKSEDKEDVLETMYEMALLGDRNPRPYQLLTAVGLAIELQQTEKAKRLADIEAHYLRDETHNAVWMQVIKYRVLAGIILEGTFKRYASQTAADAQQDADKVVEAIRAWPAKHGERQSARAQRRVELSAAGFDAILKIFEPFKWENEESARRPPASDEAIAAAEERLGLPLPDDYKEFLKISNGMGFLPDLGMPGLRSVESLEWEEFADLGLDEIDADLGLPLDPAEVDKIPKIGRAIMINSEDDEENVWLLEPAQVEATLDIVKKERKQDNYVQEVGWRVGFWTHWTVTTDWYPNFKAYLQAYALEAESKSKQA